MVASVLLDRQALPITHAGDVVVVGGSFAGIAAALRLARADRQVVLVEPRTYLGREVTATLRPWLSQRTLESTDQPPTLIEECVRSAGGSVVCGEIPLKMDAVKLCLEDLLLEAGVDLVYASLPVGVCDGLIIGNKSGRQVLSCRAIVDATATAAVARAAGAVFEPWTPALSLFSRTLEFDGVRALRKKTLSVPGDLHIVGDSVRLHRGYRGKGHVYVECQMDLPLESTGPLGSTRRETAARRQSMRLASCLIADVPAFHHAFLAATSYELCGAHTPRMAGAIPEWALAYGPARVRVPASDGGPVSVPLSSFAGPVRHMWCLQTAARLDSGQLASLCDPVYASLLGTALAEGIIAQWEQIVAEGSRAERPTVSPARSFGAGERGTVFAVGEPDRPQRGRRYEVQSIASSEVPILCSADVLVVGGGTSGATAAITAASQGMHTVLLEMNPGLGGTGTLGGVDSYWFGRRVGFSTQVEQWVASVHDALDYEGRRWNIEAKMHALLQQAERTDVEILTNGIVVGAAMEGNKVRGVVVATRFGPFAVLAQVVIDATGDGDVAAFAGADAVYGAVRDHVVMWYSLAQFAEPGRTRNNFTSMVDVSNVQDYTRAILAGRRRGRACHDHGVYVAPRESRHILGDVVLTLTDQLVQRRWPDVVNVHFSNHDIKGKTSSDWLRLGLIPPNLEVEIPYRALLPRGIEQILVAGKAISATRDALPAIRMQADLENLGGVVGLAAAQAVREGVAPRDIDVIELQRTLVESGVLPDDVLTRTLAPQAMTDAELEAHVALVDIDRPLYAYSDMEMDQVFRGRIPFVDVCAAGERAIPALKWALGSASQKGRGRVHIAQALAMCGSRAGVPVLIAEIERHLASGALPARASHIRHTQLPPDQGAMPDVVYLIYALGMARDRRSLAIWERVVDLLEPTGEALRDRLKGTFYYIDAVCYGTEQLGDPAAIPLLKSLHAHAFLGDQVAPTGFQPDFVLERQAMLELAVGRALARCGSAEGVEVLIAYLDDSRALLAEGAHSELVAISGCDHGKDAQAWTEWLRKRRADAEPKQASGRAGDGVLPWG